MPRLITRSGCSPEARPNIYRYLDLFGENSSCAIDSILRRV
ncbi:hypothetical protein ACFWSF_37045 [Streptomyces sp. NPDC058611]